MTPQAFFETVVVPNIHAVDAAPDDTRAVVNAILTLDALVGVLFEHLRAAAHPTISTLKGDEAFRDRLAERCPGYAAIRDASAALKHGALTYGTKARVIRMPNQIQSTKNILGLFSADDEIGGHITVLCLEGGIDAVRVDDAMAATCRDLLPLLRWAPAP